MLDIETSRISIAKYNQTKIFIKEFNTQFNIFVRNIIARFGIENTKSVGKLFVNSFVDYIDFHVIQIDILFLLCIQNMDRLRIYLNNLKDQIILRDKFTISIIRLYEHPFLI